MRTWGIRVSSFAESQLVQHVHCQQSSFFRKINSSDSVNETSRERLIRSNWWMMLGKTPRVCLVRDIGKGSTGQWEIQEKFHHFHPHAWNLRYLWPSTGYLCFCDPHLDEHCNLSVVWISMDYRILSLIVTHSLWNLWNLNIEAVIIY